jgi:hypothetical protein
MLIVIIIFLLILLIIGCVLDAKNNVGGFVLSLSSVCCGCVAIVALIILLTNFPYNVDKKLTMYEEENFKIETKVKETVRVYMDYEQETYNNLIKEADLTTLLIKYPELNSNELIKTEIQTYKENSKQIKELKSKQIDKGIMAWWLYFGS